MGNDEWPFDQPQNCAAITLCNIVSEGAAILHVTHDADDHGWQFLGLEDADTDQAAVISLQEIVELDPSVLEVANLRPGRHAWRGAVSLPWQRAKIGAEESA